MSIFKYWKHQDKHDVDGSLLFECEASSITDADELYKKKTGMDVVKQMNVGVTVEKG